MQRIQRPISEFVAGDRLAVVPTTASVADAIAVMSTCRADCAVVTERDKIVGIFTERDFVHRVAAPRKDPAKASIADVMTHAPVVLNAGDCISYAINIMATRGIRNVPIVDDEENATAVLDVRDVLDHLAKLFADLDESFDQDPVADPWVDIGGGG